MAFASNLTTPAATRCRTPLDQICPQYLFRIAAEAAAQVALMPSALAGDWADHRESAKALPRRNHDGLSLKKSRTAWISPQP